MYRRRTSVIPEIRVVAPSLERGLDDDTWPECSVPNSPSLADPSLVTLSMLPSISPQIYQSHTDISDSEISRYITDNSDMAKPNKLHSICFQSTTKTTLFLVMMYILLTYSLYLYL